MSADCKKDHLKIHPWLNITPLIGLGLVFIALAMPHSASARYIQLEGVADVKSRFSTGCANIQDIARAALKTNLDTVLFSDRALDSLQYGLFPLDRIIRKTQNHPSILSIGAAAYLGEINAWDRQTPETILIAGAEVAPFYYWSRSAFDKKRVAHERNKRLWVLGLQTPQDYQQIPILTGKISTRYFSQLKYNAMGWLFLFLVALALAYKNYHRRVTVPLAILFALLTLNNHPFRSSPYDPYHKSQGMEPYQEVIRYAQSKGALVFWHLMEPSKEVLHAGSVALETVPHPEDLIQSSGYNGFQAVADSAIKQTDPGKEWDQVLTEYVQRKRSQPVWGYGGSSLQCDDSGEVILGGVRTVFLVREKSRESIFDALQNGRMYSVRQSGENRLFLDEFAAKDKSSRQQATMGEQLEANDAPGITIQVHSSRRSVKTAEISLIRNGLVVRQERVSLPYQSTWKDAKVDRQGRVYYRLRVVSGDEDYLVSNPIFVNFPKATAQEFRLPSSQETLAPKTPRVKPPKAPDLGEQRKTDKAILDLPKVAQTESPKTPAPRPSPPAKKPRAVQKSPTVKKPVPPSRQKIARAGEKQSITVKVKHGFLRKGPGVVFPKAGELKQGDKLSLVRRTEIFYQKQRWLVVWADGNLAYVWAGLVDAD